MSLADRLAAERRGAALRLLREDAQYRLPETSLRRTLDFYGYPAWADVVRADLLYLEGHGLARVERVPTGARGEDLWVAVLTPAGLEVAQGRPHPGVARPEPGAVPPAGG